jgi:Zn-dependent protease/CBS domain-containing protein
MEGVDQRGHTLPVVMTVMAVKGSIRIGSVWGVALRAHWSVPLIMMLFAYGLADQTLPAGVPGLAPVAYAAAGVAGALLLLASLVVHEAAHALTARRTGIPVRDVTLWALGGMTRMERPTTARAAFAVAVSGPVASLLLGGAALACVIGVGAVGTGTLGWRLAAAVLGWLGATNLLLGVFNLLPAAPLDGGRVLQAVLWWRTGDRERAQRAAGRSGQIVGMALGAVGWLVFLRGAPGGLWLTVVGLFVAATAAAERRWAQLAMALRGVRVTEAMTSPVVTGPDWLRLDRFLAEVAAHTRHSVLPLLDFEGRPSGVVQLRRLPAQPYGRQQEARVGDLAMPLSRCTLAAPDELLTTVLERLGSGGGMPVLVMDGGRLGGIVTAYDIQRLAQRHPRGHRPGMESPGGGADRQGIERVAVHGAHRPHTSNQAAEQPDHPAHICPNRTETPPSTPVFATTASARNNQGAHRRPVPSGETLNAAV